MAIILTENFESGANGAALTTANSAFGFFNGAPTFTNANPFVGSLAMHTLTTTSATQNARIEFTAAAACYARFALRLNAMVVGNTYFSQVAAVGSATPLADFRVTSAGHIDLRVASVKVWGSTTILAVDTDYQIVWGVGGGQGALDLYDANGTLIESSGNFAYAGGNVGRFYLGLTQAAASVDAQLDALVVDDTAKPGPIVTTPPAPTATHFRFDGSVWVPQEVTLL